MADTSGSATALSPWWRHSAILVMIGGFSVLSFVTVLTYTNAPPIPEKAVDAAGDVVFTGADIQKGQEVFFKYGLMEHGSIWGHGAYLGPDYSAEYLHRLGEVTRDTISVEKYGRPFTQLSPDEQSAASAQVRRVLKENRYEPALRTLVRSGNHGGKGRGIGTRDSGFGTRGWGFGARDSELAIRCQFSRKENHMELGMIGLGRMGTNMVRRLLRAGHQCVVYDLQPEAVKLLAKEGAVGTASLEDFAKKLKLPCTVWMMVPAAVVDPTLETLIPLLERDDVVIDGGNSYYHDDVRRAAELKPKGIHYVDVGTSGGVSGSERGFCLMIGGDETVVRRLDPVFAALAPSIEAAPRTAGREKLGGTAGHGYLHCGPSGAGHFVKMAHNGIEYGIMAAYAEGLNILRHANAGKQRRTADAETTPLRHPEYYPYDLNLADIAEVWRRGSVIASWLLDLAATALLDSPDLAKFTGRVSDSGEGRWTIAAALDEAVPAPVLSAALFARFSSRGQDDFADKMLSALRYQFGGHNEKAATKKGGA